MNIPPILSDMSDTLCMTALVVACAVIIRRDVSIRIFACMAFLTVISLFSRLVGFVPLVHIIDVLVYSAPIILAVVFQTDLRRSLLALGSKRNSLVSAVDGEIETVEELMRALKELAQKQIGALIVLVRHIQLDHLITVGTQIDAKVTCELLNSIFLPYSPIHDGAVIIEKGKLTKAGCVLPLSQNPDISKSFGTRHRAALGLSELSDSYVLVVSEETGKISLIHDGKIAYDMEYDELRKNLKKALGVKRPV